MPEPTVNQLITTTLQNYHRTIYDNVTNNNALLAMLKMGNRVRVIEGGRTVVCPLAYAEEDFNWYSGLDTLPRAEKETISEAEYPPAMAAASITLSGEDLAKNRGREAILNLLEGKVENAERTLDNNISVGLYSDGSTAKQLVGLAALVADNPAVGVVGGIDPATWAFWRNKTTAIVIAGSDPAADNQALKIALNAAWLGVTRGRDKPDLILADDTLYTTYEFGLQENQRYAQARLGELGFTTLKYKGAEMVYDSAASGLAAGGGYMLNTKYMKFEIYRGRNFQPLNLPEATPDVDAITKHMAFMGALTLSNRMLQNRITHSTS